MTAWLKYLEFENTSSPQPIFTLGGPAGYATPAPHKYVARVELILDDAGVQWLRSHQYGGDLQGEPRAGPKIPADPRIQLLAQLRAAGEHELAAKLEERLRAEMVIP